MPRHLETDLNMQMFHYKIGLNETFRRRRKIHSDCDVLVAANFSFSSYQNRARFSLR